MGNQAVKGYTDVVGKHGLWIGDHTGPASYVTGGETLTAQYFGLRSLDMVNTMRANSGVYSAATLSPAGIAGAITQTIKMIWQFATTGSVASVTVSGGTGMTPGTYALAFSGGGGTGATGTLTVLTATTTSTPVITNPGSGYTSAPTVTAATGGTPPTLTAVLSTAGQQVGPGANLSAIGVRMIAIGG